MKPTEFVPSTGFGHYEIERVLGQGSMGKVYLARDTRIGRRVALKTVHLSDKDFEDSTQCDEFYRRLQREAEVGGALLHPNLVALYEAGYEDGKISFLALEYVEGETLLARMKRIRPQPLPITVALRIMEDVLRGLDYAHGQGIIHRDIKPANVLIRSDGVAKVADFGIARPLRSSLTNAGSIVGTPNYMSPEQVKGRDLTTRSDIFGTGVLLFEMLTGTRPFGSGDLSAILHRIVHEEAPDLRQLNPDLPEPVRLLVEQMLSKSPDQRPTAGSALQQVAALRGSDTVTFHSSPPAAAVADDDKTIRTRSAMQRTIPAAAFWVSALAVAALLLVTVLVLIRGDDTPRATITFAQEQRFQQKQRELNSARRLMAEQHYEESTRALESFVSRYPESQAGRQDLAQSREALEQQHAAQASTEVTVSSRRSKHRSKARSEDHDRSSSEAAHKTEHPSFLSRIRRWFHRD